MNPFVTRAAIEVWTILLFLVGFILLLMSATENQNAMVNIKTNDTANTFVNAASTFVTKDDTYDNKESDEEEELIGQLTPVDDRLEQNYRLHTFEEE